RRGQITGFTGVDDPYEEPVNPELTLDTVNNNAAANAHKIIAFLEEQGLIQMDGHVAHAEAPKAEFVAEEPVKA
ncbi:MAG: adenylyl-sulfate kinase, partial [Anaerolineae bacterium]|nr:adenylyl-sulfate kinase [Anaerolineae bacterium]